MKAIKWLLKNKHIWHKQKIEKYHPMSVSPTWAMLAFGLKYAKIYKWSYLDWDMKIDKLVKEAEKMTQQARGL